MTATKGLEERARYMSERIPDDYIITARQLFGEIAVALAQARREREEMEAALRPFAKIFDGLLAARAGWENVPDACVLFPGTGLTIGQFKRAHASLSAPSSPSPRDTGRYATQPEIDAAPGLIRASPREEELAEQLHYANGVADLAMKHRDIAEAALEKERERCAVPDDWRLVPIDPPDEAAISLSGMGSGFSLGERVKNGKWNYARLLALLPAAAIRAPKTGSGE